MSSTFFLQPDIKNEANRDFLNGLENWSNSKNQQTYVLNRPLGDAKYSYGNQTALAILVPKYRIVFVDFGSDEDSFEEYIDDFIEDLGSISDKYRYKDVIGRPRQWRSDLVLKRSSGGDPLHLLDGAWIEDPGQQRVAELLISLLIGSINDADAVRAGVPETLLEKVKRKILLFDGDQTRFVYNQTAKPEIRIQGLSGTGKTELLLHKLKEIYVQDSTSRIAFTCHNKVLADSLKRRIPDFFNFMKVEQQIKWNERLWCVHAWGSHNNPSSGVYRYICDFYKIEFYSYSKYMNFDAVCKNALLQLAGLVGRPFAFDYMFVDESQDFPESFFELCKAATRSTVYIAGDIFQSIFDERLVTEIQPDFLLSKCYRTDPRTLMFAHAIGMGLFEEKKLRWLDDSEWEACGYKVERDNATETVLKREPLRRFEDLNNELHSVEIISTPGAFYANAPAKIIEIIRMILEENPSATPDDIGVILVDVSNQAFSLADALEQTVPRYIGWPVNKAYESKRKDKDSLFISNKNNVKGLEFPFVICVTERIGTSHAYRNALYMTLTRSFLKTYMVISEDANQAIIPSITAGLTSINTTGTIRALTPTMPEMEGIRTTIKYTDTSMSFYDFAHKIFDELDVMPIFRDNLFDVLRRTVGDEFDHEKVKEVAAFNYGIMNGDGP